MTPEMLVDQWRRGLRIGHRAHYEAAKFYYRMHLVLSLPAVLVAALLSTSVFAQLQDSSVVWVRVAMAILSVLTVVLSSLQAALRFAERSERHKTAAVQLGEVRRELEQQLVFEHRDEAVIERLRKKWDAADRQAPTIPSKIYDRVAAMVTELGDRPPRAAK
jgi:hypothetical protein